MVQGAAGMGERHSSDGDEQNTRLEGQRLQPLLARVRYDATSRDRAGNRELFVDDACSLIVRTFDNPVCRSLRDLVKASRLPAVRKKTGCREASRGSLSETLRLFDPAQCYITDRGYEEFGLFNAILAAGSRYVCRVRNDHHFTIEQPRDLTAESVPARRCPSCCAVETSAPLAPGPVPPPAPPRSPRPDSPNPAARAHQPAPLKINNSRAEQDWARPAVRTSCDDHNPLFPL
jgi:hypothetical protein